MSAFTGRIVILLLLAATAARPALGETKIKLATLAPDGSPWHRLLQEMGDRWQRETDGRVRLVIYPGGIAGDDGDTLRKIRIGQLQAATLTVNGLGQLDGAFDVFNVPLFFESYDEFSYVLEQMTAGLDARLQAQGYVRLNWVYGGWIHVFSTREIRTVEAFKKLKIFVTAGDERWVSAWRRNGFSPVPLSATDVLMALESGMIEGLPVPPLGALALQWYKRTPYMLDEGVAPLIGATVVKKSVWERIPQADRTRLLAAAAAAGDKLFAEIRSKDDEAVRVMQQRGLTVVPVPDEADADWRAAASSFEGTMRETIVPAPVVAEADRHRRAFRAARERER